jgi:hypothetical protein
LRKGDSLSGFTLKEIETDKIVMMRGEEKITVPINDPSHPRQRETVGVTTAAVAETAPVKPAASTQPQGRPKAISREGQKQSTSSTSSPVRRGRPDRGSRRFGEG